MHVIKGVGEREHWIGKTGKGKKLGKKKKECLKRHASAGCGRKDGAGSCLTFGILLFYLSINSWSRQLGLGFWCLSQSKAGENKQTRE